MAMQLGMPFYLMDKTGSLTGSEYEDMYRRLALSLRRSTSDVSRNSYLIYEHGSGRSGSRAVAALDFGPDNSLGTVSFIRQDGRTQSFPMTQYLTKVSSGSNMSG